jgi:hypothetical protein
MYLIYIVSTLFLLWISIAGVTLNGQRYINDATISRSIGLLLTALILFFIEHFIGLGNLNWIMPLSVIVGALSLFHYRSALIERRFWHSEIVFIISFMYGFFWRYSYPGISPSSEKITDLFFISNYYSGKVLPPLDNWNPPHLFDYYYAFQHYAAALLGRIFNLDIGVCYNIAFALLSGLTLTLVWNISGHFIKKSSLRLLLMFTLAFGGTGFSPILHIIFDKPETPTSDNIRDWNNYNHSIESYSRNNIITGARFIGGEHDKSSSTASVENNAPMVLPSENFGYQFFLGDYHPTLGGFFVLILAIALVTRINKYPDNRASFALLALTIPVMLITNTWTFPLLSILFLCWIALRMNYRQHLDWPAIFIGGFTGIFLIYPFLVGFTSNSLPTPIALVSGELHTPVTRFIGMHWPIVLLLLFSFFIKQNRHLVITFTVTWLILLILSEFIFIDDPTSSQYQRTNTVMKWWGWIQTGVIVTLGTFCLSSNIKWIRWGTITSFLIINIVALDLFNYWYYSGRNYQGQLAGHSWFTQDASNRMMFEYLERAPEGIVLERVTKNAYSNTSLYSIFNKKPTLLGWPLHLSTWHGSIPRIWILKSEIDQFYKGTLKDPLNWLKSHDVKYIVFDQYCDNTKFDNISNKIISSFAWHEFKHSRQRHIGLWVKIPEH